MRIEVSGLGRALLTKKATGLELQLPIALYTSEGETGISLEGIEQTIANTKLSGVELLDTNGKEIPNLTLQPNARNAIILHAGKLPEGLVNLSEKKLNAGLEFKFLSENGAETIIPFSLTAELTPTTEGGQYALANIHLKRRARTTFFLNLILFALLILILNLWASQNNDVYNQLLPSFPSSIILTFIAVFLGLNLPELKNIFSSLRAAKDFFNTSEFYFQRDTIRLLNSRIASGVLLGVTGLAAYLFLWLLFPVNLDSGNESIVPYAKDAATGKYQMVKNKKAYWKDLGDLRYSIRGGAIQKAYPENLFEVACLPDIRLPFGAALGAARALPVEKSYQLDASFIGCYRFDKKLNNYTVSEITRRCEEEKKDCFCRILAFIRNNNTEGGERESDILFSDGIFKDRNNLTGLTDPVATQMLRPVFIRLSQLQSDAFPTGFSPADNPFLEQLVRERDSLEKRGYGLTRDTLARFINNTYSELADDYGGNVDVSKALYARQLNAVWSFCAYLDYLCRDVQLEDYGLGALQLAGPAEAMQDKFLGTGPVAIAHLKFLLLARSRLKVDKTELDAMLGQYLGKTGAEKRMSLFLDVMGGLNIEFDDSLAAMLMEHLKELPLAGALPDVRENIGRIMDGLYLISTKSTGETLKNKYYDAVHQYLVGQGRQNDRLDIAIIYLEQLGRYGLKPADAQIQYFEGLVCSKWGAGKREGAPPYKAIISKDAKRPTDPKLLERAIAWDSPEYLDICQQRRVGG